MPSARTWRRAAATGGLGLAGVYAFEAAQYHRTAAKDFELEDPRPGYAGLRPHGGGAHGWRIAKGPGAWVRRLTAACARTTSRPAG